MLNFENNPFVMSVIMLNVVMLIVVMLSVVMFNVTAPLKVLIGFNIKLPNCGPSTSMNEIFITRKPLDKNSFE